MGNVETERLNELLKTQEIIDLETIYWTVLRDKMEPSITETDEKAVSELYQQLDSSLDSEQKALLEKLLEMQAKVKDQENYHNFRLGVRYGITYLVDMLK